MFAIINVDSQTQGKGIHPQPFMGSSDLNLPNTPERVPWRKWTYSSGPHLMDAHSVPGTLLGTGDTAISKILKNPLL